MHLGPFHVVDVSLAVCLNMRRVLCRRDRVIAQLAVLDDAVCYIDAEAGHTAIEPEAIDVIEGVAHLRIPPVEVGLLGEKVMQVVLAGPGVERPGRAAEDAEPVVRWSAV